MDASESMECNTQLCPINCSVSAWFAWTTCNATCGGGFQSSNRSILVNVCLKVFCYMQRCQDFFVSFYRLRTAARLVQRLPRRSLAIPSRAPLTVVSQSGVIGVSAVSPCDLVSFSLFQPLMV